MEEESPEERRLRLKRERKLPGKPDTYYSADVVVPDDQSDERNFYSAQFPPTLSFSGMPSIDPKERNNCYASS